jgi:predicted pyridoxine 5'-phosphate oxidase superfamily flavin-nucleotide-binding protein
MRQITRDRFTAEEDAKVTALVAQGLGWGQIAAAMNQRTKRQVRERWQDYLSPSLAVNYTHDDDYRIEELHRQLGPRWAKIAAALGNRSGVSVRNRYRQLMRGRAKGEQRFPWDVDFPEDETDDQDLIWQDY